jgi:peroxiredoxin
MVALSNLLERGPVLIDFWALWCKPCLQSLPGTDKLLDTYGPRGLSVLAINTDSPRSSAKVKSYVKSNRFGFTVLSDPNGAMQRLYRFYRIPQTFLITSDGRIAFSQLGYSPGTEERLAKEIDKIIPPRQDSKGE